MPEEQNKKSEYLKRGEIRTMEKDMTRLREAEAEKERGRVAQIRTEEDVKKEQEGMETAKKEAEAREQAEEEAKRKGEEVKKLKEEREKREVVMEESSQNEALKRTRQVKELLRGETQQKEEKERREFLERVAAKVGEEKPAPPIPTPPAPAPPPAPIPPVTSPIPTPPLPTEAPKAKPSLPKVAGTFPEKPLIFKKVWIRIIISLAILAVFAVIATFWYWYLIEKGRTPEPKLEPAKEVIEKEILVPLSLISSEETKTLEIPNLAALPGLMPQLLTADFGDNGLTRIVIKNLAENKVVNIRDFFESFQVKAPENFYNKIAEDFTLFNYPIEGKNRLGFLVKTKEENLSTLLSLWEPTMEEDFQGFFNLMGKDQPARVPYFKDGIHKGERARFQTFTLQDLGIVYIVFDNHFIFTSSWENMKKVLDKLKTEVTLEQLDLKRKVGQLFLVGIEGKILTPETEQLIKTVKPGGILLFGKNIESPSQTKKLIQDLQELSIRETGLPLLIGLDQEGGLVLRVDFIKEKTAQSEIQNTDQAYLVGLERAKELKWLGINLNLAPVLDFTQPGDFLFDRSFRKNPAEIGELAKALVSGQKQGGVLTTIKHFPGYGQITFDPEEKLAVLKETPEISQFQKAMEAGPEAIMASNAVYTNIHPTLPLTFSSGGIDFLEESLGSSPLIISDDLLQSSLLDKFNLAEVVILPISAGVDMLIFSGWQVKIESGFNHLYQSVREGRISKARIDEAVLKILQTKRQLP